MTGTSRENLNRNYLNYVKSFDPPTKHLQTCGRAFLVGGFICTIGQFFRYMLEFAGLSGDELAGTVSVILIFLGTLLTGLGVYDRIGGLCLWHGGKDVHCGGSHHRVRRERGRARRAHLLAAVRMR